MQKSKKFITAFLATIMVMSTAACGGNASQNSSSQQSAEVSSTTGEEKTGYDTHVELSWFKEGITGHEINYDGDAYGQFWQDKFNTTFDLTAATMDDSDWSQRLRIWINSGDMPDVAHWGFNYGELVDYAAQDAVYRFPDDWKERWPNVAASQECVPGAAVAEEKLGGTYTLFRTIFANHRPSERLSYHALLYMRKDWMQACGVEIKDTYSPSELEEIATKFKEEDPGNVGSQLVPISIRTYDVPKIYPGTYFPQSINVGDGYYKDESGQFQWAPADERTLEGLKKYQNLYTSGLLDPEFYTLTRYEGTEKFYIGGTAGIVLDDGMGYMIQSRMENGLQKNLGLDPDEALHIAQLVGEDGKYYYREDMNFYGSIIFSPTITDEEFERAMDILDFCCTEEGQEIINMGFEGEDWKRDENGEWNELISKRLIDYIRVHVSQIGGLTPARKLAALCENFGVRTAWHGPGDLSPVGVVAQLHLDLAIPNFGIQEFSGFSPEEEEVFPGCPQVRNGYLYANDKPGFGIDIDEKKAAMYPCSYREPGWLLARTTDGTAVRP